MRHRLHIRSQDASLPSDYKRSVTITFRDSPFFGQEGRLVKVTLGRHSDLYLELANGKQIRIDASWTDYFGEASQNPKTFTHYVDFSQAQPIIRFLEYLKNKLTEDLGSSPAVDQSA